MLIKTSLKYVHKQLVKIILHIIVFRALFWQLGWKFFKLSGVVRTLRTICSLQMKWRQLETTCHYVREAWKHKKC